MEALLILVAIAGFTSGLILGHILTLRSVRADLREISDYLDGQQP